MIYMAFVRGLPSDIRLTNGGIHMLLEQLRLHSFRPSCVLVQTVTISSTSLESTDISKRTPNQKMRTLNNALLTS